MFEMYAMKAIYSELQLNEEHFPRSLNFPLNPWPREESLRLRAMSLTWINPLTVDDHHEMPISPANLDSTKSLTSDTVQCTLWKVY